MHLGSKARQQDQPHFVNARNIKGKHIMSARKKPKKKEAAATQCGGNLPSDDVFQIQKREGGAKFGCKSKRGVKSLQASPATCDHYLTHSASAPLLFLSLHQSSPRKNQSK
jgi:hypothetical protein